AQRGAFVAKSQPVDTGVQLCAVRALVADLGRHKQWAVMGAAALWLHDAGQRPVELLLGVPLGHKLSVKGAVRTRRVVPAVLEGSRPLKGVPVVALEMAVIQVAATRSEKEIRELVESLERERRTTLARLRARGRRGLSGSARVRRVCDELAGGSMDADVRRLKAALETRGVTGLETEVRFTNTQGASAYADLLHREKMTVFEVDGLVEHTRRERFRADRRRDRWMRREHAASTLRIDVTEIREDLEALADELAWFVLPARGEQESA
ncbi:MAG: hypothetical protein M3P04_14775, partial [Actinomycetota bacterium]|nr:hypothetical protein [Actinomycetota bacterium]